jgi:excinuclease ABC subunit C
VTHDELLNIVHNLPDSPGIYQYFNEEGKIIYVGKAKNLKRRVSSYFNRDQSHSRKTQILVQQIRNLKYIVVNSEQDALLLENNLIKKYQPRYNILLKDDKTYPSICITKEPFPRIFKTRNILKNGTEYYGPYSFNYIADAFIKLLRELYPLRTCNLFLTEENIKKGKYKSCLQYHIKKCKAPCIGLQSYENYNEMIDSCRKIIKGNIQDISDYFLLEMRRLSSDLRFEEAQELKKKYDIIEKFKSKSIIVDRKLTDLDVFSYEEDEKYSFVNMLHIVNGSIIQGITVEYKKQLDEPKEEILHYAIIDLRNKINSSSKEIIVPFLPDIDCLDNTFFTVPQRGDKKKLLELSLKNVHQYKIDKYKQADKLNPEQRQIRILTKLQNTLKLDKIPYHIECFDNSNISGSSAVAGCVVFKMGKPSKKDYRKYTIKSVVGSDDYASMREVVERRYTRMIEEQQTLPDLIIADGGLGQMDAIKSIVADKLHLTIPIAGLVKDKNHHTNEMIFGLPPKKIGFRTTDEVFHFLTHIQDEVHRFAISFHRQKRSKQQVASELDNIKGIGEKTKLLLIKHFKSVKRIKEASFDDIKNIIGNKRASIIYEYFRDNLTP